MILSSVKHYFSLNIHELAITKSCKIRIFFDTLLVRYFMVTKFPINPVGCFISILQFQWGSIWNSDGSAHHDERLYQKDAQRVFKQLKAPKNNNTILAKHMLAKYISSFKSDYALESSQLRVFKTSIFYICLLSMTLTFEWHIKMCSWIISDSKYLPNFFLNYIHYRLMAQLTNKELIWARQ